MSKIFTTNTATLKATIADIRSLDAKQIKLKDKNILDYIKESEFNSYDTRNPQLKNDELDIWNTEISLSDNGHIEVKPFEHTYEELTDEQKGLLFRAAKVINNEALDTNGNHLMYWQTSGLTETNYEITDYSRPPLCYLEDFESDLSSLTDGTEMFSHLEDFESFRSNLSSLTDGTEMFSQCRKLTTFSSILPNLMNGSEMFSKCSQLASFNSDLPSLTNGYWMFYDCRYLTSFSSDLSSLEDGSDMFYGCKLDAPSVTNIVHTLPSHRTYGTIYIGIDCGTLADDIILFAQECDCDTWQELLDDFSAKNWTVRFSCNGISTTTYNMRRGETLPVYTKLEEVIMPTDEKERKPHYAYTSADGSKFYNINYFHSTNGSTEGYDVFSSLEEAISAYNVTPKN